MSRVAFDSPGSLAASPSLTPRSGRDDSPTCCGRWTGVTLRLTDGASGADRQDLATPGVYLPRIGENGWGERQRPRPLSRADGAVHSRADVTIPSGGYTV